MLIKRDDLLLSWSPSELLEAAVKYRLENIYDFECELDANGQFARCLQAAEGESVLCLDIVESFGLREELEQYWYRYLDGDYIFWEMEWEVERAIYGSGGDNPPSHCDTPDNITEWEPIEGENENIYDQDELWEPIPDLYDDKGIGGS